MESIEGKKRRPTYKVMVMVFKGCPRLGGKDSAGNAEDSGDWGLIFGSERSPGGGNDNPIQYSHLKNPTDRVAWWATVQRVAKNQTQLRTEQCVSNMTIHYNSI